MRALGTGQGGERNRSMAGEGGRGLEPGRKGLEYGEWLHQSIRVAALCVIYGARTGCILRARAGGPLLAGTGTKKRIWPPVPSVVHLCSRRKQRGMQRARGSLFVRARRREQDAAPPRYYCTYYALAHKTNRPGAGRESRALRINPLFIHGAAQQIIRFLYFSGRARWLRRQRACKSRIIGWKYCRRFKEVAAARAFEALFPRRCSFSSPRFSCFAMNKYEAERRCRHFAPLHCIARPNLCESRPHTTRTLIDDANQRTNGNFCVSAHFLRNACIGLKNLSAHKFTRYSNASIIYFKLV